MSGRVTYTSPSLAPLSVLIPTGVFLDPLSPPPLVHSQRPDPRPLQGVGETHIARGWDLVHPGPGQGLGAGEAGPLRITSLPQAERGAGL